MTVVGVRRVALVLLAAAVLLYGFVGFPGLSEPDAPASAHPARSCISTFWGVKLPAPVCHDTPHTHPPPTTTAAPPPPTTTLNRWYKKWLERNRPDDPQLTADRRAREDARGSGSAGKSKTPDGCSVNQNLVGGKCVFGAQTRSQCESLGLKHDGTLCYGSRPDCEGQHGCDEDLDGGRARDCANLKQYMNADGACVVKSRSEDAARSAHCSADKVFYSQLGCARPCDAGQLLVGGACRTTHNPPPPTRGEDRGTVTPEQTPKQTPEQTPEQCPPGYTGDPPNSPCIRGTTEAFIIFEDGLVVQEDAGGVAAEVVLSHPATGEATVDVASSDDTAVSGGDYSAVSVTVTIPDGAQTASFGVTILDDDVHESDETFSVAITATSDGVEAGDPASVSLTIVDDDPAPLAAANFTAQCGPDTAGRMRVRLLWGPPDPPGVWSNEFTHYQVEVGGSPDDRWIQFNVSWTEARADGGVDLSTHDHAKSVRSKFVAGATVYATVTPGTPVERTSRGVTYKVPDFERNILSAAVAVCPDRPVVSLSPAMLAVVESDETAVLTVRLSEAWGVDVTVTVTTAGGTATAGEDYTASATTATIAAGDTATDVTVAIVGDDIDEPDETFTVQISSPTGGAVLAGARTSTVTIVDDDEPEFQFLS